VLHPWLRTELAAVLATLPPVAVPEEERPPRPAGRPGSATSHAIPCRPSDSS
jgi:hypothetical protein